MSRRAMAGPAPTRLWPATIGLLALLAPPLLASPVMAEIPANKPRTARPPASKLESAPTDRAVERMPAPGNNQTLSLEAGAGRILTLPGPATNVFVADPRVAEVRPASTNSLFVFGVGQGRTTIAAMDSDGRPVVQFEVTVRPNTFAAGEAEATVARLLPNSRIRVTPQARGLLLTGNVGSPVDAERAVSILKGFAGPSDVIENQLSVASSIQVNLRVRIVEMNRSVTRALGIDWQAMGSLARFGVAGLTSTGLGAATAFAGRLTAGTKDVSAIIDALATDNLVRVLAEPNLTVMSGQAGSFLVGGEFPVPVAQDKGSVTIAFKKYGISLAVVPTVMSDGRINLHVNPEVSQLTDTGAVKLTASNNSLSIPALTVRRAETSVELGTGQSFAIAGLLQDQSTQTTTGLPLLGDIPILGALFRSTSFQRQETELVILVTPYIVKPVDDPASLRTPTDRFTMPTDLDQILLLRQTGLSNASAPARIPGAAGFIVQ